MANTILVCITIMCVVLTALVVVAVASAIRDLLKEFKR